MIEANFSDGQFRGDVTIVYKNGEKKKTCILDAIIR